MKRKIMAWLDRLEPGSLLIELTCDGDSVMKVKRITSTMIITESGGRYNKHSGKPVGKPDIPAYIAELTEESRQKLHDKNRRRSIIDQIKNKVDWDGVSLGDLIVVHKILIRGESSCSPRLVSTLTRGVNAD